MSGRHVTMDIMRKALEQARLSHPLDPLVVTWFYPHVAIGDLVHVTSIQSILPLPESTTGYAALAA